MGHAVCIEGILFCFWRASGIKPARQTFLEAMLKNANLGRLPEIKIDNKQLIELRGSKENRVMTQTPMAFLLVKFQGSNDEPIPNLRQSRCSLRLAGES